MPYSNEIGLRMLIGGAVREASVLGYNVRPLFSYYSYHGPVFRVLLRVNRGQLPDQRLWLDTMILLKSVKCVICVLTHVISVTGIMVLSAIATNVDSLESSHGKNSVKSDANVVIQRFAFNLGVLFPIDMHETNLRFTC